MSKPYGSVEYYYECFSDIIGDVGDIDLQGNTDYEKADKIMKGFEKAVEDWLKYHVNAAQNFQHLQDKFLYLRDSPYNN